MREEGLGKGEEGVGRGQAEEARSVGKAPLGEAVSERREPELRGPGLGFWPPDSTGPRRGPQLQLHSHGPHVAGSRGELSISQCWAPAVVTHDQACERPSGSLPPVPHLEPQGHQAGRGARDPGAISFPQGSPPPGHRVLPPAQGLGPPRQRSPRAWRAFQQTQSAPAVAPDGAAQGTQLSQYHHCRESPQPATGTRTPGPWGLGLLPRPRTQC